MEPPEGGGASITGAYEGWWDNKDGTHTFLIGYLNRNRTKDLDIPIGPNNHIDPGGPDQGQPTHFLGGRQWGMFTITVPKEFTIQQRLTWTIVANGQPTTIPLHTLPDYVISPFVDASKNTPPVLQFEENGPSFQGPIASLGKALERTATVGQPLSLTVWAQDDKVFTSGTNAPMTRPRPPVTFTWSKYRGTGEVKFDKAKLPAEKISDEPHLFKGKATTTATFGEAGDYVLQLTANDYSGTGGGGGFQCCWSTQLVKVTVK